MATHSFKVQVGDQVFVGSALEEVGAVRKVAHDHLVIYIEGGGEFRIEGPEVVSAHDGKLVLDAGKLPAAMQEAIAKAHENEE
jgi:hypothetical protein